VRSRRSRLSCYSTRGTSRTVTTGESLAVRCWWLSEQRAAVAFGCIAHQSLDMLYKPELAQEANSGKAAIIALTVMLPTFPGQFTPIIFAEKVPVGYGGKYGSACGVHAIRGLSPAAQDSMSVPSTLKCSFESNCAFVALRTMRRRSFRATLASIRRSRFLVKLE
jgi:hypothetical protein